jgi:uncharacterized small protein (DUF1192 family)
MSNDTNNNERFEAQQHMAKQRLLKANNVQRRRFEGMASDLINKARRRTREIDRGVRKHAKQAVIKEVLGDDLQLLLDYRERIQRLKQEIEQLQATVDKTVRPKIKAKGLHADKTRYSDPLDYFVDPPAVDEPDDDDVCKETIGDPLMDVFSIKECRGNPTWVKFEHKVLGLDLEADVMEQHGENLMAQVWQLVTTDEIVWALQAFREEWIDD